MIKDNGSRVRFCTGAEMKRAKEVAGAERKRAKEIAQNIIGWHNDKYLCYSKSNHRVF